jgi:hypothetical protein
MCAPVGCTGRVFIFGFYCFSRLAQIALSAARWRCSRAFRALIIANEFLERDFGKLLGEVAGPKTD